MKLTATGGAIGGLMSSFTATTDAGRQLDWTAGAISGLVNGAQAEGLTGNGALGSALFATAQPGVTPAAGNTGSAVLAPSVSDPSALPSSGQGYTLSYSASGWSATVTGTSQSYALGSSSSLTLNGMNIAVTGIANPGDSFQVAPQPGAAAAMRVTTTNPADLAVADPYVLSEGSVSTSGQVTNSNAGTISESSDTVLAAPGSGAAVVPASAFGDTFELRFTSNSAYDVVDTTTATTLASGTFSGGSTDIAMAYPSGSASAGRYWQVRLSGAPAAGDVVTLKPGGLDSGSNAQRMSDIWRASDTALPGGSVQGALSALIGRTGAASSAATALSGNTASNLSTAQADLSDVAGVNLDDQAEQLSEYQQAYQAAAKVITTAEAMFKSLINAV
ncbi:flagellar basal body rod C-terminal domain-containing protein [Thioclava dalianensis]|uniref:flagellar basal body rod C-terminal domain-containing protein n=1 Tax=Thioclava dalianensis TaxID=1185766 RepID=UPI0009429E76|nr:flagellar basal body rod C-terminal domain-containing protein [Thioclava dalianensis]